MLHRLGASDRGATNLAAEQALSEFLDSVQSEMDDCMESVGPILAIKSQQFREALVQLKNRGVKIRYITEVTPDNIQHCKELMQYADLRHLEGIRGNFAISETKQLILLDLALDKPVQEAIITASKELVEQQRYLFNVLWSNAIPVEQRIKQLEEGIVFPQTQVINDFKEATNRILTFLKNAKRDIEVCASSTAPSVIVSFEPYRSGYVEAKRRGVMTRIVTEITKDNIQYCKEILKFAELRHADGIKGNFAVTETEYIASATLEEGKTAIQIIYSNVKQVIDQQKYFFDTLWQKGIPADQRIREIEEGKEPEKTEILTGETATTTAIIDFISKAQNGWCDCGDKHMPSIAIQVPQINQAIRDARGKGRKLKYITEVTDENIEYCKKLAELVELRHLDNVKANFAVSDTHYIAATVLVEANPVPQVIYSNAKTLVEQQKNTFDALWSKALPAEQRIKEIEAGIAPTVIEIIPDPHESMRRAHELLTSSEQEVQAIFASPNTFLRFVEVNALKVYGEAANRGVHVRLLAPANKEILPILEEARSTILQNVDVRIIEENLQTGLPIIIVDKQHVMIWELKDDEIVNDFASAVGRTTYSNSDSIVDAYSSIYETLWRQTDLYSQLENTNKELMHNTEELKMAFESLAELNRKIVKANEELKLHDKMQSEFIKIAAHELRTPIQPLLGVADILSSQFEQDANETVEVAKSEIEIIMRNARRLERLSSDILQVSRIESQSLKLYKETFDLNKNIKDVVSDMRGFVQKESQLEIVFQPYATDLLVYADKMRIFEVISNILRNAIKFTDEGAITVSCKKSSDDNYVVVSIKDTGTGIDQQMLPRLFTKFAVAQSDNMYDTRTGSGLGLFIARNIVEAHGGKIWAENNNDGKGATFSFTLPLAKEQESDGSGSS